MHAVPATDPLAAGSLSAVELQQDFMVNTTNALVAVQQLLAGPTESKKSFIYTGNFLNVEVMPALLTNGLGKSAAAHLMHVASEAYKSKGYG